MPARNPKRQNKKSQVNSNAGEKSKVKKKSSAIGRKVSPSEYLKKLSLPTLAHWEFFPVEGRIFWSENAVRFLHAKSYKELPEDRTELFKLIYPEDASRFGEMLNRSINNTEPFVCECRVRISGGSFVWIEFTGMPVMSGKKIKHFFGTVRDVTTEKIAAYELADWKTRNELVSESAGLLIYDYDIRSGEIVWSGNLEQVVGFTIEQLSRIEQWEEKIHPDDREETNRLLEDSMAALRPFDVYYRFAKKGKDYAHIHDRGLFVPDSQGKAVRMLGIMSDVSDRMGAIKTIEQSEKSYRELFNCVGEAIYIQDGDGTFVDVNREACVIYGYAKEEIVGRTPEFLSAPGRNDYDKLKQQIDYALAGYPQQFVWWGKKKSGEVFPKEVRLTRGTYFGRTAVIATAIDITAKVASEKVLQESERRFRAMIEDLNVGVFLQGPDEKVQIVNKSALLLLRRSESETVGHPLTDSQNIFVTESGSQISANELPWIKAASEKRPQRGVVVGLDKPGSDERCWLLVNAEPTLLDDENLLHVLVTLTDITERKKAEEQLKESELRFRTLQEASFGGIGLHNKGMILDCNQGLCDITGYSYEELIGSNGLNLIAPEYRDYVLQKILTKDENPYDVEGLRKDGTRYFLEIHGKNIPYGEGLIRVTEFRNITDRKLAEAQILEQNARLRAITDDLQQKNDQLREFTQIVSHNLRAPVGNILSLLNFIENAENDEERNEYITLLKEAGTTTLTTLHELNEVLQIKQNKNIERQRLKFEEVFGNVCALLNARIAESKADIATDFSEAPEIEYPNIYLESILLNLLSNALKYTYPGRRPVIRLKTIQAGGAVAMTVSDNGAGINMERYGSHIFKLRKTFHKHPESRGIGLFMIKNQIETMGGSISVSSIENEGSTFFINFSKQSHE